MLQGCRAKLGRGERLECAVDGPSGCPGRGDNNGFDALCEIQQKYGETAMQRLPLCGKKRGCGGGGREKSYGRIVATCWVYISRDNQSISDRTI